MPLFPRLVPHAGQQQNSQMDLATLLSLLSDPSDSNPAARRENTNQYHHQAPSHTSPGNASHYLPLRGGKGGNEALRAFTPKFDIFETKEAYILEGELPGLTDKKMVEIEFTDAQTLLVKGKIEKKVDRHEEEQQPAAAPAEETKQLTQEENTEEASKEEHNEKGKETPARPRTPPKPAYVEDSPDEDDGDYEDARRSKKILTPTSTVTSSPKQPQPKKKAQPVQRQPKPQPQQQQPQIRYWVSERTIGSFQRTFSFPGLIDQDAVTAKLENGLLTVVVPKRTKMQTRRVEIL